jgi:hypothetical protein
MAGVRNLGDHTAVLILVGLNIQAGIHNLVIGTHGLGMYKA